MSTLGTQRISSITLHVPYYGAWRADVVLDGGALPVVGAETTLTVGDLVLKRATISRADFDQPDRPHAVVVGGHGWSTQTLTPISYQSDAGVRLSTVLADLAARAGQAIETPTDVTLDNYYVGIAARAGQPARLRDALADLARSGVVGWWRVDADGVTRFGARPGGTPTARATTLKNSSAVGMQSIGIDSPASFLPGVMLTAESAIIQRLVVLETSGSLTAEAWT